MTDHPDPAESMTRREAIRRAVAVLGVAVSPAWLSAVEARAATAQGSSLTAPQLSLTGAIAERILPRTNTPGALDAGVPAFIDRLYSGFMTAEERNRFAEGLTAVDGTSRQLRGAPFTSLHPTDQDDVLRQVATAAEGQPQSFFLQIRSATILGYFTSEIVGKTVLHYDPVPGRFDACVPISDVGNVNWTQ